MSTSFHPN